MESARQDLINTLVVLFQRVFLQMRPSPLEEWSDIELTMPQYKALVFLSQGPKRMGDIAHLFGITLSSATKMIDRLVTKGLVGRSHDEDDRRVVTCILTVQGRSEVEWFWRIKKNRVERIAKCLGLADLQAVVHAIDILASAAEDS